jgi:hypothetical protein
MITEMSINEILGLEEEELNNKRTRSVERKKAASIKNEKNRIVPSDKQSIKERAINKRK